MPSAGPRRHHRDAVRAGARAHRRRDPPARGQRDDPAAVVDARGKVHGLANVYVADATVIPVIPRANTNLPARVVGVAGVGR